MPNEKIDTKERVLQAAKKLFAEKGFAGTSIREIAEESEANVSAINYHFRSKQGLYWAMLHEAHEWLANGTKQVCEKAKDPEDMIAQLFTFLTEDTTYLMSTMRSLLSDSGEHATGSTEYCDQFNATPGMPGYEFLARFVRTQLQDDPPEEAIFWAVNSIFSTTIHMALMSSTMKFKVMEQVSGVCGESFFKQQLTHIAKSSIEYADKHRVELKSSITIPNGMSAPAQRP
ncbi:MAG: TetR/AcrR family transcriptional regulator [Pseudobacteriovorax sp.]|nr:TetR/AcrR family transcriptional regulator [Pseudobacteriovorax sp.]